MPGIIIILYVQYEQWKYAWAALETNSLRVSINIQSTVCTKYNRFNAISHEYTQDNLCNNLCGRWKMQSSQY
jgi:hypothetical protein